MPSNFDKSPKWVEDMHRAAEGDRNVILEAEKLQIGLESDASDSKKTHRYKNKPVKGIATAEPEVKQNWVHEFEARQDEYAEKMADELKKQGR